MCKGVFLIIFASVIRLSFGARILGVVPSPSYSHQVVFQPLWRELSLRGHQLTVLTTDPINDPTLTNLTEIDLGLSYELWNKQILEVINMNQKNFLKTLEIMVAFSTDMNDKQFQHPQVQELIKNETEHFDLLIVEFLMPSMIAFAERFKCPFIGMTSLDASSSVYEIIGSPAHPVLNPDVNLPFVGKLTFMERLISTAFNVIGNVFFKDHVYSSQQKIVNKHFGETFPYLQDIERNMSMLFVNTDNILHQIRPLAPAVVQIGGGSHKRSAKQLPKDLQKLLDKATQGFIYFSLGTNVKSKDLSQSTQKIILETFTELPYLVLWKFELEDLPNKPKNVFISKWFPQQDIFRHSNIKLFITQGGQQSLEETIHNNIPIIGMPFFGDQPGNINRLVAKGLGLSIDHMQLDKESFKQIIVEVISNPKYRNRVKELADLIQDQPMSGFEKAIWWTEYVLRHKGAKHLRSPALDIPFYQYFLLDVIGFCSLVVLVVMYLIIALFKIIFRLVKYLTFKAKQKVE